MVLGLALLLVSSSLGVAASPTDWGERWRAVLPARERHPSLFYDEADRQRMRQRITRPPFSLWWQRIQQGVGASGTAFVWWLTGDESAARRARTQLVEGRIWRQQPQGYLEPSSHSLADYVIAYDLLAAWSGLSRDDHERIRRQIAEEAEYYYGVMEGVTGGANYGNQRTLGASALGMAALALCEYQGSRHTPAEWLARALHEIRREENWWFFRPGGLFVEGVGYTTYMNTQFVPFAIAYERASGHYLFDEPRLQDWLAFAAYQTRADGEIIYWGTCESQRSLGFCALLANRRYGGRQAALFHHVANAAPLTSIHPYHLHLAIAHYDPGLRGSLPPPSRAFLPSQTVVLRSGWGPERVEAWFAGKDGTWPLAHRYDTYSHADTGHFMLVAWNEVLANDSGYDHWKSHDYYGPEFHNVPLVDGKGPAQNTFGTIRAAVTRGPVQYATMSAELQGCRWRRTFALVRGRYAVVADRFEADREHEYTWQIRSACPPGFPGTALEGRTVTWSGLSPEAWRALQPGKAELTIVAPAFARLSLERGRWMPMSDKPEFANQVALARWRAASTSALFVLIPNRKARRDVSWALYGSGVRVRGPGWSDALEADERWLYIRGSGGDVRARIRL